MARNHNFTNKQSDFSLHSPHQTGVFLWVLGLRPAKSIFFFRGFGLPLYDYLHNFRLEFSRVFLYFTLKFSSYFTICSTISIGFIKMPLNLHCKQQERYSIMCTVGNTSLSSVHPSSTKLPTREPLIVITKVIRICYRIFRLIWKHLRV